MAISVLGREDGVDMYACILELESVTFFYCFSQNFPASMLVAMNQNHGRSPCSMKGPGKNPQFTVEHAFPHLNSLSGD